MPETNDAAATIAPSRRASSWVLYSTEQSIKDKSISLFAIAETFFAIWLYWELASLLGTQKFIWLAALAVPVLLLRSNAAVAKSIDLIGKDMGRNFIDIPTHPRETFRSFRFWYSIASGAILGTLSGGALAYIAHHLLGLDSGSIVIGGIVGYVATQVAIGLIVASVTRVFADLRLPAIPISCLFFSGIAIGVGVAASWTWAISAGVVATLSSATAVARKSEVLAKAKQENVVNGMTIVRAMGTTAPVSFFPLVPGFLCGAWLQSVGIRLYSTFSHLRDGIRELPENWWRTVMATDLATNPEIIPGYDKPDLFNIHFLLSKQERLRLGAIFGLLSVFLCWVFLIIPGYVYRLTIKSAAWAHAPFLYLLSSPKVSDDPSIAYRVIWEHPVQVTRLIYSAAIVFLAILAALHLDALGDSRQWMISTAQYLLLVDFGTFRIWQWCNIIAAALTLFLFAYSLDLKVFADAKPGSEAWQHALSKARIIDWVLRLRTSVTIGYFGVLVLHGLAVLLPDLPCESQAWRYFVETFFHGNLPPTTKC